MNALTPLAPPLSSAARAPVRIVIVGHVDHGKSTLIGRLLAETGSLPDGKLEQLKAVSKRRGMPFEWSFLLDALQTERDQGITIDTSQIRFRTASRDIVLIDAPGHAEFLRNMITGAAQADAALLIVDAAEGVREQTRRHGYLLHLLGIRQVAVVINKMDRVRHDAARFAAIRADMLAHLSSFGLVPSAVIPIAARDGEGVARHTDVTGWYDGPSVLTALDGFAPAEAPRDLPLRLPVQAVYKFDDRRIVAGRIETGRLAIGDEITVGPGGARARVKSIESWPVGASPVSIAEAGRSVGITLDREIFVERGQLVSSAATPAVPSRRLQARIFWLHRQPLAVGAQVVVRIGTADSTALVTAIDNAIDPGEVAPTAGANVATNHVADVTLSLSRPLACDTHTDNPATGRLVLEFDGRIAGGGLVLSVADAPAGVEPTAPAVSGIASSAEDLAAAAARLGTRVEPLPAGQRLAELRRAIAGRIVFTTSFGIEDQAITHLIAAYDLDIDIVTIDTGRLFEETHAVWADTEARYGRRIRAVFPRHDDLEKLVARDGANGFRHSHEARHDCCFVRKVEPLARALAGASAWVTGLRAEQSAHRRGLGIVTVDAGHGLLKASPLFDWTREEVATYAAAQAIPLNALHAAGFASIGCAPCTRAIAPGEPERAGRWWWESDDVKECGLHVTG
jgi:phosphoadenylyl-sulfate reductase (thioredoxin)